MVLMAGRFPKPPHPDISELLARDEPAKISPHRRRRVVVLVEFHPDIVQARDQPRYIGLRESWDRSSALSTAQRCLRLQVPVARRGGD